LAAVRLTRAIVDGAPFPSRPTRLSFSNLVVGTDSVFPARHITEGVKLVGWSRFDASGQATLSTGRHAAQVEGNFLARHDDTPVLATMALAPDSFRRQGLGLDDFGAALFVKRPGAGTWELAGIGSRPAAIDFRARPILPVATGCRTDDAIPANERNICDLFVDATSDTTRSWMSSQFREARNPRWDETHRNPDGTERWYGDRDYVGPCRPDADRDCDRWFDTGRDNCPFVDNGDQDDVDGDGIGDLCSGATVAVRCGEAAPINVSRAVYTRWTTQPGNSLGCLLSVANDSQRGRVNTFERGIILEVFQDGQRTGQPQLFTLRGSAAAWTNSPLPSPRYGYPASDETSSQDATLASVETTSGHVVFWRASVPTALGPTLVRGGPIHREFVARGGLNSLGIPSSDETTITYRRDGSTFNGARFGSSSGLYGNASGVRLVSEPLLSTYLRDPGKYGAPRVDAACAARFGTQGCYQPYAGGGIVHRSGDEFGVVEVTEPYMFQPWLDAFQRGLVGYPADYYPDVMEDVMHVSLPSDRYYDLSLRGDQGSSSCWSGKVPSGLPRCDW
jgi:hypothetical protein